MKHDDIVRIARDCLVMAELPTPVQALDLAASHIEWLIERNKTLNLTRVADEEQAVRLHLVDSLLALRQVEAAPEGPLCDIGTGGGFPGLPLSLWTGRDAVLVDSVAKKVRAVEEFLQLHKELHGLSVYAGRAEDLALAKPAGFAIVVARAVSSLPALVELASPLLIPGGTFIAYKAVPESSELASGDAAADLVGMKRSSTLTAELPGGGEQRTIISYSKVGASSIKLPRRVGLAQNHPLR